MGTRSSSLVMLVRAWRDADGPRSIIYYDDGRGDENVVAQASVDEMLATIGGIVMQWQADPPPDTSTR